MEILLKLFYWLDKTLKFLIQHQFFLKNTFVIFLLGRLFLLEKNEILAIAEIIGGIVFILSEIRGFSNQNTEIESD